MNKPFKILILSYWALCAVFYLIIYAMIALLCSTAHADEPEIIQCPYAQQWDDLTSRCTYRELSIYTQNFPVVSLYDHPIYQLEVKTDDGYSILTTNKIEKRIDFKDVTWKISCPEGYKLLLEELFNRHPEKCKYGKLKCTEINSFDTDAELKCVKDN